MIHHFHTKDTMIDQNNMKMHGLTDIRRDFFNGKNLNNLSDGAFTGVAEAERLTAMLSALWREASLSTKAV